MDVINFREYQCSKCTSTCSEEVRQGNMEFTRCRNCKHEGVHREVIPTTAGQLTEMWKDYTHNARTF